MKFTVVGDSHGSGVFGLIEELPSGVFLSIDNINQQLLRRQTGYGRGERMEREQDKAVVRSGLWRGVTTGAPLLIEIPNKVSSAEKSVRSIQLQAAAQGLVAVLDPLAGGGAALGVEIGRAHV